MFGFLTGSSIDYSEQAHAERSKKKRHRKRSKLSKSSWERRWWVLGGKNRSSHTYSDSVQVFKRLMRFQTLFKHLPLAAV